MLGIVRDKILSIHLVDMSLSLHPKDPCNAADVLMNPMPVTAFVPNSTDTRSWRLHSQIRSQRQEEQAHQARLSQSIADMPTLMPQRCSYQSLSIWNSINSMTLLRHHTHGKTPTRPILSPVRWKARTPTTQNEPSNRGRRLESGQVATPSGQHPRGFVSGRLSNSSFVSARYMLIILSIWEPFCSLPLMFRSGIYLYGDKMKERTEEKPYYSLSWLEIPPKPPERKRLVPLMSLVSSTRSQYCAKARFCKYNVQIDRKAEEGTHS